MQAYALFLLIVEVDGLLFPGCGVYRDHHGQNTCCISPRIRINSLAMLSFMLHDRDGVSQSSDTRGTLTNLQEGVGVSRRRRGRRRRDNLALGVGWLEAAGQTRTTPRHVAEQGLELYSSISHRARARGTAPAAISVYRPLSPTARSTTTRPPQDSSSP